ncbi:hypothetical protein PTKIN_Ptkin03bG0191100 [Pterospermum kingtungense]
MTMEEKWIGYFSGEEDGKDQFPVGMRVLAVDDDPICLKVLENLLRKCKYQVTTCNQAIAALTMLRENKNKYDLVISDVNMPDMDGFKLLELVGLEMDLPVIMLSAHSDTKLVMKGITHGAVDYLLKPVRIEELKNIWQHVVRRKKFDSIDQTKVANQNKARGGTGQAGQTSTSSSEQKVNRKRKEQSEDEEEEGENGNENEDASTQKKPRVVWSVELHRKFVGAVNQLGLDKAVPKKILDLMNVEGLTRENVASHLQKYRLYLKRLSSVASQQANMVVALGSKDPSYFHMGSLDGFGDFRTFSGPGRLSSASLSTYQSSGVFGRLNSSAALSVRGIPSGVMQQGHSQTLNNSINGLGKIQPAVLSANQNQNSTLFQGIPTSVQIKQLSRSKSTNQFGEFSQLNDPHVFGSLSNSLSTASGNPLLLQESTQRMQQSGAYGNQSSLGVTSLNQGSFAMGVFGSSNVLDHGRCSESWQGAVLSSNFPSTSLSTNEAFCHEQLPTNNLQENVSWSSSHLSNNPIGISSSMVNSACFEDSRGNMQGQGGLSDNVIQNIDYSAKQQWADQRQDYIGNLNNSFGQVDSLVSARGSMIGQSNAINAKTTDVSLFSQLSGQAPYVVHQLEGQKSAFETKLRANEDYLFEQTKPQSGFGHNNVESLEDIVSSMVKPEQNNENELIDGEFGLDGFPLGSCM